MSDENRTDDDALKNDSLHQLLLRLQMPFVIDHYHELAQAAAEHQWGHLQYLQVLIEGRGCAA